MMKNTILLLIGFALQFENATAQDGFSTGVQVATSFQLNTHRSKTTAIWSSESGYGFALGMPLRFGYADKRAFVTGVNYEYMAFDNWVNNNLVSSVRFHSMHIPAMIQIGLASSWHFTTGGGLNMVIRSRTFTPGNNWSISNITNPIQPYLAAGIVSIADRSSGKFELGAQIRYHFLDLWKKSYTQVYNATSSKVLSLDLVMRFYL